jgi:hypothetical protein
MVDTGIFCTTAEVQYKAGANASATANVEAYINNFVTQAESRINAECHYNFSDSYAGLNVDVKGILKEAASSLAATYVINYDLGSIGTTEAKARVDILMYHYGGCIKLLQQQLIKDFVIGA